MQAKWNIEHIDFHTKLECVDSYDIKASFPG